MTKSNKKFYIKENNVWVTDGLEEDTFERMLNTDYHSNIYNLSTFKTIRRMLDDVINNEITDCAIPKDVKSRLNGNLFHFILNRYGDQGVEVKGLKKSQNNENNDGWKETQVESIPNILSYKQLNNNDLALITKNGIFIYTIVEDSTNLENLLALRYFWKNEKWKNNDDLLNCRSV